MNPQGLVQGAVSISLVDLLIALLLAFALGLGCALIYRVTHRGLNYERSFLVSLVLVGPIVAMVMVFIGSNLALSLGMVGALSIIRFRTVIKDSRDMVFLFWMIATGLGCGTYNWAAVSVAAVIIAVILLVLFGLRYGQARHSEYVLVSSGRGPEAAGQVRSAVAKRSPTVQVRSLDFHDDTWEQVLEVRFPQGADLDEVALLAELRSLPGVEKVSLLAPQLVLPV
jgi:hypothetical protein